MVGFIRQSLRSCNTRAISAQKVIKETGVSGAAALGEQLPIGKVQDGRGFVCLYGYRTFPFLAGGQKYADIAAGL